VVFIVRLARPRRLTDVDDAAGVQRDDLIGRL
jgi:hypothetical protein